MQARAAARKRRRAELQQKYAERKAALETKKRAAEEAERRRVEEENSRARREKDLAEQNKRLRIQRARLAKMHNHRRLLLWHGWKPWRSLVEFVSLRTKKARNFWKYLLVRRYLSRWKKFRDRRRRKRIRREMRRRATAASMYFRRIGGNAFSAWRERCAKSRERRKIAASRVKLVRLRRHVRKWRLAAAYLWRLREKARELREERAQVKGRHIALRHLFLKWKVALPALRSERVLLQRRNTMLRKANRWLEELEDADETDEGRRRIVGRRFRAQGTSRSSDAVGRAISIRDREFGMTGTRVRQYEYA